MKQRIDNFSQYLKENDIKPSFQRVRIFEYLHHHQTHPTIDEIYKDLVPDMPTLSKTTVYNTLGLFVKKGIAQQISIEDVESRYDSNLSIHGHFKCEKCGKVMDFDTDFSSIQSEDLKDCQINQKHIYFKGICKACR